MVESLGLEWHVGDSALEEGAADVHIDVVLVSDFEYVRFLVVGVQLPLHEGFGHPEVELNPIMSTGSKI